MGSKLHNEFEVLRLVWHHTKGQHLKLSLAMLLELLIGLFPPVGIYFLQSVVGIQVSGLNALLTRENILLLLVCFFFYILLTKVSRLLTAYAMAEVEYSLRMGFVRSLSRMSYSDISSHVDLQSSNGMVQEIAMASGLVPMVYRSFIRAGVTIVGFCVLLLLISPDYFAIVLSLTVVILVSLVTMRRRVKRIHKALYTRISSLFRLFGEWVGGHRVFLVYGCMDFAVSRMQDTFRVIRALSRRLALLSSFQSILAEVLTYSVAAVIIVLMPTNGNIIDIGVFISFPTAILFIRSEAMILIYGYQQLANTESSIMRLFQIINSQASTDLEVPHIGDIRSISFEEVTYSYHIEGADTNILKDASMLLEKGRFNVIVGSSGVGKSTTLNLLLGLLHPQVGSVSFSEDSTAAGGNFGIALVEQEPFFFDGSLYDNICMGRGGITMEDIKYYLQVLHLAHLFSTTESLTEPKEMLNRRLSTGEKQRIALIRALVGHPSVLVVDEGTSNIDPETSHFIIDYLYQLSRRMLVVAVSHDPALIEKADTVYQIKEKKFINN